MMHGTANAPRPSLGISAGRSVVTGIRAEGYAGRRMRPRCACCGARHPQADEPADVDMPPGMTCPECGALAAEPTPYVSEIAIVADPTVRRANWMLRIGAFLHRLADRMQ